MNKYRRFGRLFVVEEVPTVPLSVSPLSVMAVGFGTGGRERRNAKQKKCD